MWTGEVTPELEMLFGDVEIVIKTSNPPFLSILTKEGHMLASVGDWIIKGVAGELYPCKPEIFAQTYSNAETEEVNVGEIAVAVSKGERAIVTCDHPGCTNALIVEHRNGKVKDVFGEDPTKNEVYRGIMALAIEFNWARIERPNGGFEYLCVDHNQDTVCARCLNRDCSCMGKRIDRLRYPKEN